MKHAIKVGLLGASALLAAAALTPIAAQASPHVQNSPAMIAPQPLQTLRIARCVRYWSEARYTTPGYDHVVTVESGCDKPVRCEVSTNVDPDPIVVDLAPKQSREVITRVGSPARKFAARVACHFLESGPKGHEPPSTQIF